MVGYASQTKPLIQGGFNQIDFALEAVEFGIGSVVITPGDNPAHPILRGVIRRKPQNDPDLYDSYTCATYTKMQLDLTNIKPRFRSKRLQRNFGFVFDYIDTSALTGQAYLPAMISEATADYYHSRRNPAVSREIIRASRVSGVEDSFAIAQFTGQMHGNVNFYANYIDIFNVRFASPLSDSGLAFYDYFLVDSMQVEGRKTYKIRFHPKRLATPVLDGEVNIDSASYALQSASARMPKGVNVNWIKHLRLENDNRIVADSTWFRHRDRVSAEFSIATGDSSKLTSFIGTREVLVCKGVWGTLSKENDGSLPDTQAPLLFPRGMTSVSDPYVEMGFGVENIFRLLRVDCIWRLTHRDPKPGQDVQNFAVNLSMHLKF